MPACTVATASPLTLHSALLPGGLHRIPRSIASWEKSCARSPLPGITAFLARSLTVLARTALLGRPLNQPEIHDSYHTQLHEQAKPECPPTAEATSSGLPCPLTHCRIFARASPGAALTADIENKDGRLLRGRKKQWQVPQAAADTNMRDEVSIRSLAAHAQTRTQKSHPLSRRVPSNADPSQKGHAPTNVR